MQINRVSEEDIEAGKRDPALLPKIIIPVGNQFRGCYVLESWLGSGKKPRRSWICRYGFVLIQLHENNRSKVFWACKICDEKSEYKLFSLLTSNSSAASHLQLKHRINENGNVSSDSSEPTQRSVISLLQQKNHLVTRTMEQNFKSALLQYIVANDRPFSVVQSPTFRKLFGLLNPLQFDALCPTSGMTVRRWLTQEYQRQFQVVKQEMARSISRIHLSFDLWTSPAMETYLSLVSYFVDEAHVRQVRHIAMERVFGGHSGENQAYYIKKICERFEIFDAERLAFWISDNADNCDTTIRSLLAYLYPSPQTSLVRREALEQIYRCRCIGHILNLIAKAFLEGTDIPNLPEGADEAQEQEILGEWRKQGPVGKLHNIVHWIQRSPKRKDYFKGISLGRDFDRTAFTHLADSDFTGLGLKKDNSTRWNSTLQMILRALKVRKAVETFCTLSSANRDSGLQIPKDDVLSEQDWQVLSHLTGVLHPLFRLTRRFEGNTFLRFHEVIASLYKLQDLFEEISATYESDDDNYRPARLLRFEEAPLLDCIVVGGAPEAEQEEAEPNVPLPLPILVDYRVDVPGRRLRSAAVPPEPAVENQQVVDVEEVPEPQVRLRDRDKAVIRKSIEMALKKLTKYRKRLEVSVVPWAAAILHPSHKLFYIGQRLPDKKDQILADFYAFYGRYYPAPEVTRLRTPPANNHHLDPESPSHNWFEAEQRAAEELEYTRERDEVAEYLADGLVPFNNLQDGAVLEWWAARADRWPRLFRMALDLLTIPPESSENERAFSQGKLTITSQRYSLQPSTLNILLCMKQWSRCGIYNMVDLGLSPLIQRL